MSPTQLKTGYMHRFSVPRRVCHICRRSGNDVINREHETSTGNKIGNAYSFEYTNIPKVFLTSLTAVDVSRVTKGITSATIVSQATMTRRDVRVAWLLLATLQTLTDP